MLRQSEGHQGPLQLGGGVQQGALGHGAKEAQQETNEVFPKVRDPKGVDKNIEHLATEWVHTALEGTTW